MPVMGNYGYSGGYSKTSSKSSSFGGRPEGPGTSYNSGYGGASRSGSVSGGYSGGYRGVGGSGGGGGGGLGGMGGHVGENNSMGPSMPGGQVPNTGNYPSRGDTGGQVPSWQRDTGAAMRAIAETLGLPSTPNWSNDRGQFDRWGTQKLADMTGRSMRSIAEMARTVAGEAANQTADQRAAVANVMENRLALGMSDPSRYGYLGGGTVPGMLRGFDANGYDRARVGAPNSVYSNAMPGTENYTNGLTSISDALDPGSPFNQTAPDAVRNATHYYNPAGANPSWGRRGFTDYGDHVFGNAERTAAQVASLRGPGMPTGGQGATPVSSSPYLTASTAPPLGASPATPMSAYSTSEEMDIPGATPPEGGWTLPSWVTGKVAGAYDAAKKKVANTYDTASNTVGDVLDTANEPLNRLAISLFGGGSLLGGTGGSDGWRNRTGTEGHGALDMIADSLSPSRKEEKDRKKRPDPSYYQWQFPQYSQTWAFTPPPPNLIRRPV